MSDLLIGLLRGALVWCLTGVFFLSLLMAFWGFIGLVWAVGATLGSWVCDALKPEDKWFENHYYCRACDEEWQDYSTSACTDACPKCGTAISPCRSEDFNDPRAE